MALSNSFAKISAFSMAPAAQGMNGAIEKADILAKELDKAIVLQQFKNPDNPDIHRKTTALELLRDTNNSIDIFVAAVGTGGTLTGTSEVLKEKIPSLRAVAVEPEDSAILSGGSAGAHKIQGIGAGFIPDILNTSIYDDIVTVSNSDAYAMARRVAKEEGLLIGISAGANLHAAYQTAQKTENRGKIIVTVLCDTAERYLSTELFDA